MNTVADIVKAQMRLLQHLGVTHLRAVVGPSYGGFQAFQWAVTFPDFMDGVVPVVTSPLPPTSDRAAGLLKWFEPDPNWNGGDYYDHGGAHASMTQIRMATLKTYGIETRLRDTLSDPAEIEAAIREEAAEWAQGFDANSLLILARALRGFDVTKQFSKMHTFSY